MKVVVVLAEMRLVEPQFARARGQVGECRLGGFLHDVAELAGDFEAAFAGKPGDLDEEDVATGLGPGEPRGDARPVEHLGGLRVVAGLAEEISEVRRRDGEALDLARGELGGGLAAETGDFAFKVAYAGLAGVLGDQHVQGLVREVELACVEAVLLDLLGNEVAAGDLALLRMGIAGELEDLHPVAQGGKDRVEHVGGRDEENLREVEGQVQVVIAEVEVLGGVQHFEQGRGGVPAQEIRSQLVDLVEHEDRVIGARALDGLKDPAGHGPDVRAPVAPDLGLVAHAAEAHPDELAPQGARDALPEAGLAHARRADQTEDGALQAALPQAIVLELVDRQVLEDSLLDLGEVVMVLVQDLPGAGDVQVIRSRAVPGQVHDPVEVGPDDRMLGGAGRQALQPSEFALGFLEGLGRRGGLGQLLAQLRDFRLALVALPELLLNGLDLLA
ncbi:hypothetical protein D3C87_871360 [compost metagenome]